MRKSLLWLSSLALISACSLGDKLPEGRITCSSASDCPPNWSCRASAANEPGLWCYRTSDGAGTDAAVLPDGGTQDAALEGDGSARDSGKGPNRDAGQQDAGDQGDAGSPPVDSSVPPVDAGGDAAVFDASMGPSPTIDAVLINKRYIDTTQMTSVTCLASDPLNQTLSYQWTASLGTIAQPMQRITQFSSTMPGPASLGCMVSTPRGATAMKSNDLRVYPEGWLVLLRFSLDVSDSSGNGNDGMLSGGGVYVADRAGNTGAALAFDGNTTLTLPNPSMFDLKAWTFVATVNPKPGKGGALIEKGATAFGEYAILLYPDNDPSLPGRLQYYQGVSSGSVAPFSALLSDYSAKGNTFFQLVVTRSTSGELRTYIDGRLSGTVSNVPGGALVDGSPVTLGSGALGNFTGIMDEVQIYDRVLTPSEVMTLVSMQ